MSWLNDRYAENHMVLGEPYYDRPRIPKKDEPITDELCGGVHDCWECDWVDSCWDAVDQDEEEEEEEDEEETD